MAAERLRGRGRGGGASRSRARRTRASCWQLSRTLKPALSYDCHVTLLTPSSVGETVDAGLALRYASEVGIGQAPGPDWDAERLPRPCSGSRALWNPRHWGARVRWGPASAGPRAWRTACSVA